MKSKIIKKEKLSPILTKFILQSPLISASAKPGQFIIVWPGEKSERIPLTISDIDRENGTITIIFQEVGKSTVELGKFNEGDLIPSLAGPMGRPSEIEKYGTVVVVGGGVGTAIARPVAKALKNAGNKLISILGAREKSLIILEDDIKSFSDELIITTDDGSYGRQGLVTDALKDLIESQKVDMVFAVGPLPMMRAVANLTESYKIKTVVSLDPIMIDGTGMCGGCRVTIGGETKFTCVDGPEFDAHLVDWDELKSRKAYYFDQERKAYQEAFSGGGNG
ncbi:MAG: sulfide/dihydroorotate dehydrogenase-like FAD/NAD-binding protein [Armatimonadota bacterium]